MVCLRTLDTYIMLLKQLLKINIYSDLILFVIVFLYLILHMRFGHHPFGNIRHFKQQQQIGKVQEMRSWIYRRCCCFCVKLQTA